MHDWYRFWAWLSTDYHIMIDWIGVTTGLPDTILHIHAGMIVLLLARIVTGRSLATPAPWLCVVVAEACNETLDRIHTGSWRWPDTRSDVFYTLLWPTLLMIGLRLRRAKHYGRRR